MSTKITTPILIDLPGETLPSENTNGVVLPKGLDGIETLIVAGGGGATNSAGGGGGGAGGVLTGFLKPALNTGYNIQVGAGGNGASPGGGYRTNVTSGNNSFISSWIANGGGHSSGATGGPFSGTAAAANGGSGGGAGGYPGYISTLGYANQTSISPLTGYGNNGGSFVATLNDYTGAGGGGAGAVGQTKTNSPNTNWGGAGGVGIISTIIDTTIASTNNVGEVSGSDVYFGGGGGGFGAPIGDGGLGGGGDGGTGTSTAPGAGTPATGGGGGGAYYYTVGGDGGSGVIILKYPDTLACTLTSATGLTEIVDTTSVSGFKISIFKVSSEGTDGTGTITFTGTSTIPLNPSTGEFRYNQTDKLVEFYNGSTWKQIADEYISGQPSACVCNFPTTGSVLYQFQDNLTDTCGLQNASLTTGSETYGTGKFGKAFDFNGSTYLGINSALPFSSSFSISFWVYPHNLTSGGSSGFQRLYAGAGYGGGTGISLYLLYNYIDIYADPGGTRLFYQGTLVENVWQHIVLTRTYNTKWELYLDGSLLATYTSAQLTTDFSGTSQTLGGGTYYYDGLMDQFRVFGSALTADQVDDLYNEVACT